MSEEQIIAFMKTPATYGDCIGFIIGATVILFLVLVIVLPRK